MPALQAHPGGAPAPIRSHDRAAVWSGCCSAKGPRGHSHARLPPLQPAAALSLAGTGALRRDAILRHRRRNDGGTLEDLTGSRATGYRAPWFELTPRTPDLLAAEGIVYDSSLMGDDVPWRLTSGVVEIPVQWMLEDWEQFAFNAEPHWGVIPEDCDKVYRLWWQEFAAMRDFGCCFALVMHPWLMGRPSRVRLLERLVRDIQNAGNVWFARGRAEAQRSQHVSWA